MAWILVIVAGLFEVAMALCLKGSRGFTQLWPSLGFLVFAVTSFGLLNLALKDLEVGTAYAVWVGIGAVGTAALGMLVLGDDVSAVKIGALALIIVGVIGLNLAGGAH
ncbi:MULTISPECIES: multidrug efflux SMR transporter [Actinomadura]|uniref:QacE family quaternary ammonium compound efflux SMR transporter n=1 Tax=Actinomadura litoris TaxID=2678616 RepID=A0A7K1L1G5_9ACTN|nr:MULTISPECIES: multidrug efflux SMR transporter [Actinomadura]MBT2206661.1 multidrug efflux SMR transporter [Actinomadura sp. NEAU-AAG7]MUN38239.1 QacE family quaternary ammonium compound efflux SMR transporter [Actinomadura litoris]